MSVQGCSCSVALQALTGADTGDMKRLIAARVVKSQMQQEANLVAQLMESGKELAAAAAVGGRVDFRA